MIKEYFIQNYYFYIFNIHISNKFLIVKLKISNHIPKFYYKYLFKYLYGLNLNSLNIKPCNKYYKILILNYIL